MAAAAAAAAVAGGLRSFGVVVAATSCCACTADPLHRDGLKPNFARRDAPSANHLRPNERIVAAFAISRTAATSTVTIVDTVVRALQQPVQASTLLAHASSLRREIPNRTSPRSA